MKKALVLIPVMATLVACSSTGSNNVSRAEAARAQQVAAQKETVNNSPSWFASPPKSTDGNVYATGTWASTNIAFADSRAIDIALAKLCVKLGGEVNQQSKIYQREVDGNAQEFSETTIRNICRKVDVSGFTVVNNERFVDQNGKVRAYVLLRWGSSFESAAQPAQTRAEAKRAETVENARKAFEELDRVTATPQPVAQPQSGQATPLPDAPSAPAAAQPTAAVPVDQLGLVEVDNEEYKKKRAEALQKPGAVYGRMTVPM